MYTLYEWFADDEGGFGVCETIDFNERVGYHPESGWRARPSIKIGEFSNVKELALLLQLMDPDEYNLYSKALEEAHKYWNMLEMED